jgi:poly-gamma-glutamate synthesis protein (capsule biosynthesis protein)
MFAEIQPLVSSVDLAICHLETPVVGPDKKPQTYPRYATPEEIVAGIASAGYDHCSTASNHSMDQGVEGVASTVNAFEAAGMTQSGMARNAGEAEPKLLDVNGVRLTHLSYAYHLGWISLPDGESWWANEINTDRIIADARKAREMGAEIVIVSMHWGVEPASQPSPTQIEQANTLTASGLIDLIVGHHSHVVQPIQQVNGVWTVFGMGNSLSNMPTGNYPPSTQDGVLVEVDFEVAPDGKVTVHRPSVYPTRVNKGYTFAIQDVLTELARPDLPPRQRAEFDTTLRRVSSMVGEFVAAAPFHEPERDDRVGSR